MMPPLSRRDRRQPWLALLLMLSLLFTQWLGYGHAIAHGGNAQPEFGLKIAKTTAEPGSPAGHQKSPGACASVDAATLGAGVPMADFVPAFATLANGPVTLPLRTGWHRLFTAHFSTRAPPLNA